MPKKKVTAADQLIKAGGDARVKRITPKKFKQIEREYTHSQKKSDGLLLKREELEALIRAKHVEIPPKEEGGQVIIKRLTPPEIRGYRRELAECKLEIKVSKKKLKSASADFSAACSRNVKAVQSKIKTINQKDRLKKEVEKQLDQHRETVLKQISNLKKEKDHRYEMLEDLAFINGSQFNTLLNKVVKEKQPTIYKDLNYNSQVKTKIYRAVREFFGWDFTKTK